jgi:hypothetical protein
MLLGLSSQKGPVRSVKHGVGPGGGSFGILLVSYKWIPLEFCIFSQKYSVQNSCFQKFQIQRLGHLYFKDKTGENIPFKTRYSKFKIYRHHPLCFKDKTVENISFKTAEGNNGQGN